MSKPRIIVEVLGGVVQSVYADEPIEVQVLDWDNDDDEAKEFNEILSDEARSMEAFL